MKDENQDREGELFDVGNDWKREWKNMPEFISDDLQARRKITVLFIKDEDVEAFAKLVGRNITPLTKSFVFPVNKSERTVVVDES